MGGKDRLQLVCRGHKEVRTQRTAPSVGARGAEWILLADADAQSPHLSGFRFQMLLLRLGVHEAHSLGLQIPVALPAQHSPQLFIVLYRAVQPAAARHIVRVLFNADDSLQILTGSGDVRQFSVLSRISSGEVFPLFTGEPECGTFHIQRRKHKLPVCLCRTFTRQSAHQVAENIKGGAGRIAGSRTRLKVQRIATIGMDPFFQSIVFVFLHHGHHAGHTLL